MAFAKLAEKIADFMITRRSKTQAVNFSRIAVDFKTCLICMPSSLEMVRTAAVILPLLASTFPNRKINVLLSSSVDPQSHEIIKKFATTRMSDSDVDRFSLPTREFMARLSEGGVGICIDMDPYPNFLNSVICLRSGAMVRAAFEKGVGLPYYNFLVKTVDKEGPLKEKYTVMAQLLQNFGS